MDNKEFDKNIKEKLDGLEGNAPINDWDEFSKILGKDKEFQDVHFDQTYFEALKRQRKGFNSLHWVLLKNRLEKEALLRKEIYKTKLFESIFILLLAFTFINFNRYYNLGPHPSQDNNSFVINKALLYPNLASLITPAKPNITKVSNTSLKTITNESIRIKNAPIDKIEISQAQLESQTTSSISISQFQSKNERNIEYNDKVNDHIEVDNSIKTNTNIFVDKLDKSFTDNSEQFVLTDAYPSFYIRPSNKPSTSYLISTGVTNNITLVKSPQDQQFNVDAYNIVDAGFTFNLGISARIGNHELSTGLDYVRVGYDPKEITEYTSIANGLIQEKKLKAVKFQIVHVPINFTYHINPHKKTHFWGRIGLGMNLAILSNYKVNTTQLERVPELNNYAIVNLSLRGETTALEKKNFHPGALEQGSFFDNFFLSSHIDFGLERRLTDNLNLITSLGYSTSFSEKGIGPNQDTYDAIRIGLGLSFKI